MFKATKGYMKGSLGLKVELVLPSMHRTVIRIVYAYFAKQQMEL